MELSPLARAGRTVLGAATACVLVTSLLVPAPSSAAPPSRTTVPAPATLADYWAGTADWEMAAFYPKEAYELLPGDGGFGAGTMIDVGPDGAWYWFYRTIVNPPGCSVFPSSGTVVRRSTDRGRTWGPVARVVTPEPGTPWACDATDGDAHWDGAQWFYLFQCRSDPAAPGPWGELWNICAARNPSPDPTLGTWVPVSAEPVMGDYPGGYNPFVEICDQPADDCSRLAGGPGRVGQPGTPSMFTVPSEPGWAFVDLHAVDPGGLQYQSIVKTRDFRTFVATGTNLPGDAIFDRDDVAGWREPVPGWHSRQIGGGGGAVVRSPSDGMYYNLVEASDGPGGCVLASAMDLGLLRASSPAATTWSQPNRPGRENPVFYSQQPDPSEEVYSLRCSPSYSGMLVDPGSGETYAWFYRRSSDRVQGVYLFKLAFNLLANGDGWRCVEAAPWALADPSAPASSFAIWRDGNWASDGGCYFALTRDVFQDVAVAPRSLAAVDWGGHVAVRQSGTTPPMGFGSSPVTGRVALTLDQYNSSGSLLATASVVVDSSDGAYRALSARTAVHRAAVTLRLTVAPATAGTAVLADQLFVRPGR